jgi:glycosyltransferase involved in cell wall biosynthesis
MHILYIAILDLSTPDAARRHTLEMCRALMARGHDVTLCAPLAHDHPPQGVLPPALRLLALRGHVHGAFQGLRFFVRAIKRVWPHTSTFDVVYSRASYLDILFQFAIQRLRGVPYVAEINGIWSRESGRTGLPFQIIAAIERVVFDSADAVVTVTEQLRDFMRNVYHVRKPITVVSNAADVEAFQPMPQPEARRALGIPNTAKLILFVGNLGHRYGVQSLIEAVHLLHEQSIQATCYIVGQGPEQAEVVQRIETLGLAETVHMTGRQPADTIPLYVNAADVCVMLHKRGAVASTGLAPLKLFEYMACGKPVVATDLANIGDLVRKHRCGLVVEPDSPAALADGIRRVLADPAAAAQMGANGQTAAVSYYSWDIAAERIEAVLERVSRAT